jgi:hypothetical protein
VRHPTHSCSVRGHAGFLDKTRHNRRARELIAVPLTISGARTLRAAAERRRRADAAAAGSADAREASALPYDALVEELAAERASISQEPVGAEHLPGDV